MECNKDDALKAKELAEEKLLKKDYGGARIFAMRARDLDPNLAGLRQLLAAIEVNFSAERRVNGQVDWYGVLGVPPLADDATIRRCYRKLARVLRPNKNKSVGTADAYKLITHACSLLSDKDKKIIYDQNRNSWGKYEEIPGGNPSFYQIGFYNINILNTPNYKDRDHMNGIPPIPTPVFPATLKQTFWTTCESCGVQFEYHNVFINCKLICFICHQPFFALEVLSSSVYRNESPTSRNAPMMEHNFNSARIERNFHALGRNPMYAINSSLWPDHLSMRGGISSVLVPASSAAEAPGVYGMSSENLKRRYDDSTPVIREEGIVGKTHAGARHVSDSSSKSSCFGPNSVLIADSSRKIRRTDENQVHGDGRGMEAKIACQNGGIRFANEFVSKKDNPSGYCKQNGTRDALPLQWKIMLIELARKDIHKKLDELKASSIPRNSHKIKNTDAQIRVNEERATSGVKHAASESVDSETVGNKCFSADSIVTEFLTMSVTDPDFHDFDGDRIENAFGKNEIWAVYDDDDGMPRFYALINHVISKKPFKMRISWLSSMTNDELAPIKWVSSGFAKTVGDLQIGRRDFSTSLNSFSHRVNWTKGSSGLIHIYPKKGDVWALYRNWSADWNEFTKDEVVHKYDMVEVLDDYSEHRGINVAPLVKVAGFKTVFSRNADPGKFWNIPKAEMFRFSHQVPSYLLTGQEGHNAPSGCLELDPAATPMELLLTATKAAEEEMTTEKPLADEPKPSMNSSEDAVEIVPKEEMAKAMERKESCPEVVKEVAKAMERKESCPEVKEVAKAMERKESCPEIKFVYKRRCLNK